MRVATWNINGLRSRLDFVLHWLEARRPDVVGLQELKVEDESFPRSDFEAAGYSTISHGQKAWNGVAILARDEIEVTQVGLPGEEDLGARLVTATIDDLSFTDPLLPQRQVDRPPRLPPPSSPGSTRFRHISRPLMSRRRRSFSAATSTSVRRRSTAGTRPP